MHNKIGLDFPQLQLNKFAQIHFGGNFNFSKINGDK